MLFRPAFLLLLAVPARAQISGYVVKVDSDTVYLDIGESSGAAAGGRFTIYTEGTEIRHPVGGAVLGRTQTRVAEGLIETAAARYCIGRLENSALPANPSAGQRVRLSPPLPAPVRSSPAGTAPSGFSERTQADASARAPFWRSPPIDFEAAGLAAADVDGDGKTEILLADGTRVRAYPQDSSNWNPTCGYADRGTGVRFLSIDAADLDRDGKAEVFATYHNSFFNRVETAVLECRDRSFHKTASLPWATRSYQEADGSWKLAAQQILGDPAFPFGNIYALEHRGGKYAQSGPALQDRRLEWLYGFARVQDTESERPSQLFYTASNRLRLQNKKRSWVSPEAYGQTANRVRWHERLLSFRPRLIPIRARDRFAGLYTLANLPGLGGLAGAFGIFSSAELHRLKWNGLSLETEWKTPIAGYAADVVLSRPDASGPEELLVAVVGSGGKTSVWKFQP